MEQPVARVERHDDVPEPNVRSPLEAEAPASTPATAPAPPPRSAAADRRTVSWRTLAAILAGTVVLVAGGGWLYQQFTTVFISDARIAADMVAISSRVPGWVTAVAVIEGAVNLSYHGAGWDDAEAKQFFEWLPRCARLTSLHLGANEFGDAVLSALASTLVQGVPYKPALSTLVGLYFPACRRVGAGGVGALAAALKKGALPNLRELTVPCESEELRDACTRPTRPIKLNVKPCS